MMTWGRKVNVPTSTDRYRLDFRASLRSSSGDAANPAQDMEWDWSTNQFGDQTKAPHDSQKLDALQLFSQPSSGAWQLVREYRFAYDFSLYSDGWTCSGGNGAGEPCNDATGTGFRADPSYRKLTLKSVTPVGRYDTTPGSALPPLTNVPTLPALTFSYHVTSPLPPVQGRTERLSQGQV
jgi:hypothetical protein